MTADNSRITGPKQAENSGIDFIARLFCVNWQLVNTCQYSVSYTCLRKKYLAFLSVYLQSTDQE